jgi:hypothetical protein
MTAVGHERRFRPVRRMSAYLLTAAEKQTSANRCLGPKSDIDLIMIDRLSDWDRKLKQSTLGLYPARPQPSSVFLDDRLADR